MLDKVSLRHKEWVKMALAVGCPKHLSEDIVQEAYIRLWTYRKTAIKKLFLPDGSVSDFYMFVVIRNTFRTEMKKENTYVNYEEFYNEEVDTDPNMEFEIKFSKLISEIKAEANTWGAYNSKLFNLYFKTDLSMRKIASGTGIGLTHIYTSISKYREKMIDMFEDDYRKLNIKTNE